MLKKLISKIKDNIFIVICISLIVVLMIIAVACKSTASLLDIFCGNFEINWKELKEIIYNLSLGAIASILVSIGIDISNKKTIKKSNMEIKRIIMREFSILVNKSLWEISSNTDRDILSITHNYDHLEYFVIKRVLCIKKYCDDFIEKYNNIFDKKEIELLNNISFSANIVMSLLGENYKKLMIENEEYLERYYYSKRYTDMPLKYSNSIDQIVIIKKQQLDRIVDNNKKLIDCFIKNLKQLKLDFYFIF